MATERQKSAARRNLTKARAAQSATARGTKRPKKPVGLTTARRNDVPDGKFAFPKERKEPLTDARHVRNAISSFDQVEDVTDAPRDRAWKRILAAAKTFDVEVGEKSWRELFDDAQSRRARARELTDSRTRLNHAVRAPIGHRTGRARALRS